MAQSYSNYVTLQNIWYHLQDLVLKIVCVCVCVCHLWIPTQHLFPTVLLADWPSLASSIASRIVVFNCRFLMAARSTIFSTCGCMCVCVQVWKILEFPLSITMFNSQGYTPLDETLPKYWLTVIGFPNAGKHKHNSKRGVVKQTAPDRPCI